MTMTTAREVSEALDLSLTELTVIFRHAAGRELRAVADEIESYDSVASGLSLDLVERLTMLVEVFEDAAFAEIGGDDVHPSMEATRSGSDEERASAAPSSPPFDTETSAATAALP